MDIIKTKSEHSCYLHIYTNECGLDEYIWLIFLVPKFLIQYFMMTC